MTHQSHQTNGASLEDCHTNFFALTDLCGIKWRKFVNSERPNASSDPLDDPILRSYSRCMQADILCVWRRVQSQRQDNADPNAMFDVVNTSKVHPPLSLAAAKELWIFWYGEEPDLTSLVDAELLKVAGNQMMWNGTWERGLTYECRSLLFKALHNLMERFVLTKDIVRFGKWFVQPCTSNERIFGRSSQHLSFSFTFFVHGDTVCASIDLREHPAVRPLTKEHLTEAAAAFAAAACNANSPDQQTSPNSPNNVAAAGTGSDNIKFENCSAPTMGAGAGSAATNNNYNSNQNNNNNNNNNSTNPKPRKVILAPFGMAATLTGNSYKTNDPMAEKILEDWASFFPLCNKENSDVPPVVEVIAGGHKMFHPSIYVLVTDLDDMEEMEAAASQKCPLGNSSSAEAAALAALSSANQTAGGGGNGGCNYNSNNCNDTRKPLMETNFNNKLPTSSTTTTTSSSSSSSPGGGGGGVAGATTTTYGTKSSLSHMVDRLKIDRTKVQPYYDTKTRNFTCNTTNTHAPPQAACEMPERAWQDSVTNPLHIQHQFNDLHSSKSNSSSSFSSTATSNNNTTTTSSGNDNNLTSGLEGEGGVDQTDNVSNSVDIKPNTTTLSQKQQQQQIWGFVDPTQKAPCICTNLQFSSKSTTTTTSAASSLSSSLTSTINAFSNCVGTATAAAAASAFTAGGGSSPSTSSMAATGAAIRLGSNSMTTVTLSKSHSFGSLNLHQNLAHFSSGTSSSPTSSSYTSSNIVGQQQRPSTPPVNNHGDKHKMNFSSLRVQRIPFHKRHQECDYGGDNTDWSSSSSQLNASATRSNNFINSSTNSMKTSSSQFTTSSKSTNPAACYSATFYQSSCSSDNIPKQSLQFSSKSTTTTTSAASSLSSSLTSTTNAFSNCVGTATAAAATSAFTAGGGSSPSTSSMAATGAAIRLGSNSMTTVTLSKSHSFGSLNLHQNLAHFSSGTSSSPTSSSYTSSNIVGQQQRPSTPPVNNHGDKHKMNFSSLRVQRIPFHKRHQECDYGGDNTDWSSSSSQLNASATRSNNFINSSTNSMKTSSSQFTTSSKSTNPAACYSATFYQSSCSSDNIPKQSLQFSSKSTTTTTSAASSLSSSLTSTINAFSNCVGTATAAAAASAFTAGGGSSPSTSSMAATGAAIRLGSNSMTTVTLSKSHSFGSLNLHQNLAHFSSGTSSSPTSSSYTSSNIVGQQQRPSTPPVNNHGDKHKMNFSSLRVQRIPFHKRHQECDYGGDNTDWSSSSSQLNASATRSNNFINSSTNSMKTSSSQFTTSSKSTNPAACYSATFYQSSCSSDNIPKQRSLTSSQASSGQTPGNATPLQGGISSYSRNSLNDCMPIPSVGSPGTPAASPHPNSALSQPTSVPPADQLCSMSPRAPTSVSNLQQPNTPIDHLLDKNTPAPTPTDQHDNKSITSPYIHPAPSVEPPPSVEGIHNTIGPGSVPPPPSVGRCTPTLQQQQQQQQPSQQQSQHQQQCGSISVKKFDLQPVLTPLSNPLVMGGNTTSASTTSIDIKLESGLTSENQQQHHHHLQQQRHHQQQQQLLPTSSSADLPNNFSNNTASSSSSSLSSATNAMHDFFNLYKPPKINVKDIDTFANGDCLKLDVLYDFTVQDAWANHPVKRFKPNEISKQCRVMCTKKLYEGHTHIKPLMPSPRSIYGSQLLSIDPSQNVGTVGGGASLNNMDNAAIMGTGLVGIAAGGGGNTMVGGVNSNQMMSSSGDGSMAVGGSGMGMNSSASASNFFKELDIKTEVMSGVPGTSSTSPCKDSKSGIGGNLFTVEGLNPSPNDLEQLFETSSNDECGSVQIHTPPDSNNPSNGCAITTNTIDELKRSTQPGLVGGTANNQAASVALQQALQNCNNTNNTSSSSSSGGGGVNSLNNSAGSLTGIGGGGANTIQAEDLTKMFPTPPSHEQHHPNSSPCQMDIQMTDLSVITASAMMGQTLDTGLGISGMLKMKQEYSIELGSPVEEPIEDWSYVFRPPHQAKFVGSSKYAPLTNLPSLTMPPLIIPTNCRYKPSWQQPRNAHQQQQQQQQLQQQQQQLQHQQHQQQQHQQLHELLSAAPRTPLQQPRTPLGPMSSSPMHNTVPTPLNSGGGGGSSSLLLNQLNCPQAALTNTPPTMQQLMQRTGMSPISPAAHVPFPLTSPMMQQQQRQTHINPPPPYEVAVASPALSTASSSAPAYLNKMYHSQEPAPQTPQSVMNHMQIIGGPHSVTGAGSGCGGNRGESSSLGFYGTGSGGDGGNGGSGSGTGRANPNTNSITQELPEVSSVIVNILLYDTALNVFRDHNFDSSTVCVCNADNQHFGNIRGSDSGVYVPLPGTTFNPTSSSLASTSQALRALSAFGSVTAGLGGGLGNGGGGIANSLDSPASLAGAGSSSSSTTPSTTTPGNNNGQQYITGYVDDDAVECTCGFSAVINRRLACRAGLFYEDEMEITGIAEDPGRHKKHSLLTLITTLSAKTSTSTTPSSLNNNNNGVIDKSAEQVAFTIFDLLMEQCSIIQTSSSAIHRSLQRHRRRLAKKSQKPQSVAAIANVLEYIDANDIIALALEQARLAFDDNNRMDCMDQQMVPFSSSSSSAAQHRKALAAAAGGNSSYMALLALTTGRINVHKWPYIPVGFSRNNKDIVSTMKSIQPMLQNAFHTKSRTAGVKDAATYIVSGPLTWRQFHRLAGRASGQCEPQPIPSVIVGHDKDWISVAPLAIHYWDKFLLEPYSYARDVVYLVMAPDNDYVLSKTKTYFKELSSTYEMCKLGKHTAICGWNGLLTVQQRPATEKPFTTTLDNWLRSLEDTTLAEKLRLYAYAFQHQLAPYLNRVPNDKTLLNPPDNNARHSSNQGNNSATSSNAGGSSGNGSNSNLDNPSEQRAGASDMDHSGGGGNEHSQHSSTSNPSDNQGGGISNDIKPNDIKPDVKPPLILGDPLGVAECLEEVNPTAIVLYVVEPFSFGSDSPELERLACIALLRMYSELLKAIPDSVRSHINIQIISLESILELGRSRNRKRFSDEIKCLALNIFSQCKRHMVHAQAVKSLTGFGTAANVEAFLKTKDDKNRKAYKMYTPPYILAPMHEKNDKTDFSRAAWGGMRGNPNEQKYSVMYCNYCLSEDQSWLLATVTDDRGEMLEKVCINIDVPNRTRRRRAPARRIGLNKLMDYILGLISQTTQTWRLVVGRIGRIGHNELKSWSYLLGKSNLQKATKQLKDMCKQCHLMYPPTILSACLVTLEPDAKLRVMPDQFTPDERFSQISIQNPLSTPQDVTCTHILVFPTSAVCLSFTRQFQNEPQVDIDDDFINFGNDEDENEVFKDADLMDDLLGQWNSGGGAGRDMSNHNSPDRMEDNRSWQSVGGNNFNSTQHQDLEEVGQINQQPLAVGYMVSTAPTGRMPTWFWSACPHLEDVCPVFLKTALHIHVPNIQTTDDILNSTNAHSSATDHPLDSTLTADVLRYVLEGYNALSWLALDSNTHDRLSCLPINVQTLMDLYYLTAAIT